MYDEVEIQRGIEAEEVEILSMNHNKILEKIDKILLEIAIKHDLPKECYP